MAVYVISGFKKTQSGDYVGHFIILWI